jgi:RNA polymerase sigma-70 factor (sigma-E family)
MARGDAEFVEFAEGASARLLHAAYLLTGDRHRAEDAAQTALARTYASWSRVRRQDPYAYARAVLVNHVIDGWRRPLREYAVAELPERVAADDVADEAVRRRWLIEALSELTARERAVVVLRHYFDLPEAAVAHELNVSLGTVKSTASRALDKLRAMTARWDATEGGAAVDGAAVDGAAVGGAAVGAADGRAAVGGAAAGGAAGGGAAVGAADGRAAAGGAAVGDPPVPHGARVRGGGR